MSYDPASRPDRPDRSGPAPRPDPARHARPALDRLVELAGRTYGWFRSSDAAARGVAPRELSRLRKRGAVETPCRDVNRIVSWPDSWDGRALGALWSAGERAVLGRWAALRFLLGRPTAPDIDVVVPRGVQPASPLVAVRTSERLEPADVVAHGPFRVTRPAFTVCDLAAVTTAAVLTTWADRLVAASLLTADDLHAAVTRFAWIDGVATARLILAELNPAARWTRSDGEAAWARIIVAGGFPPPIANLRVTDADGRRRYLDFAWLDRRVAVELDLHPSHGTTIGRRRDGARQNALVVQGWTILRFDLADLMLRPDQVLRTVAAALAA